MNLVVVPLEGVSQTLFWQYREAMPTLWKMSERAIMFRRFYSNSTSAFQSFCDLAHGDSSELDHNLQYPSSRGCLLGRSGNMWGILRERGFATFGIQHGECCPEYVRDNYYGAWPDACGAFQWCPEYDAFFGKTKAFLKESRAAGKPFALYYCDRVARLSDNCLEKSGVKLYHERLEKGYSLLDGSVAKLMETLEELSLLDSTVLAVLGPYGMDPWKHDLYGGRTHAIDPYADVCWTPMFLYNNGRDPKIVDTLACSVDVKPTLLKLVIPEHPLEPRRTAFSGINLMDTYRDVVFTQNLFALERENEGPARGLAKSYGVTDGDQRLIVASDGGIAGTEGMEFFYDPRDPANTRNLLDFFTMDEKGTLITFGKANARHPHFLYAFRPDKPESLIRSILDSYNPMREVLRKLIINKESEALKHCPDPENAARFNLQAFKIKRKSR